MLEKQLHIGIMTGTSLDGIDISLVEFWKEKDNFKYSTKTNMFYSFDENYKTEISKLLNENITIKQFGAVQTYYSNLISDALNNFITYNNIDILDIFSAGIHGQTVWHETDGVSIGGYNNRFSLQLINAPLISNLTGLTIIFDFRNSDIANGGQGAPLVPIFDLAFLSSEKNRALINIGGISNITFLHKIKNSSFAFDCGPGNVWIDYIAKTRFNLDYDHNGQLAQIGKVNGELLQNLLSMDYLKKNPPKSTGRELFSINKLKSIIGDINISDNDLITTITHFTSSTIIDSIKNFLPDAEEIIVTGGGAKNSYIMNQIKEQLSNIDFIDSSNLNLESDYKESIAFAFLSYLCYNKETLDYKQFTGANKNCILGSICFKGL